MKQGRSLEAGWESRCTSLPSSSPASLGGPRGGLAGTPPPRYTQSGHCTLYTVHLYTVTLYSQEKEVWTAPDTVTNILKPGRLSSSASLDSAVWRSEVVTSSLACTTRSLNSFLQTQIGSEKSSQVISSHFKASDWINSNQINGVSGKPSKLKRWMNEWKMDGQWRKLMALMASIICIF